MHYRRADLIWFKEPYMDSMLESLSPRPRMFISNPAPPPPESSEETLRNIDFLWVNRLLPERTPEVFINVLGQPALRSAKAVMLGLLDLGDRRDAMIRHQEYCFSIVPPNLDLREWDDPNPFFRRARFFVMLGDQIFGNNALMEAMASGVIPIVTRSFGIERLIDHGVNGFLVDRDPLSLVEAMSSALQMDSQRESQMRAAATQKVNQEFNEEIFVQRLEDAYDRVTTAFHARR
jgi:glycosyltransferase involved in cell wall biosynthesis